MWLVIGAVIIVIVTSTLSPIMDGVKSEVARLFAHSATSASPNPVSTPIATAIPSPNTNTGSPSSLGVLTPQEVQSWCSPIPNGGTCDISRFVQFRRANGTVLPYAVQLLTGEPVGIKLPVGFTAYVWDCYHGKTVTGPLDLPSVCTMTVARGTQVPD